VNPNDLTAAQYAALDYVVEHPGSSTVTMPCRRSTIDALEALGLVKRSELGRSNRRSLLPMFVWPTAAALLATGRLREYRREVA